MRHCHKQSSAFLDLYVSQTKTISYSCLLQVLPVLAKWARKMFHGWNKTPVKHCVKIRFTYTHTKYLLTEMGTPSFSHLTLEPAWLTAHRKVTGRFVYPMPSASSFLVKKNSGSASANKSMTIEKDKLSFDPP